MKFVEYFIATALILTPSVANAQIFLEAEDKTFLGDVNSSPYDPNSICNPYGAYGSDYSESVFNRYGTYGSPYQANGAFNPNAKKPPKIIDISTGRKRILGRVTVNTRVRNSFHPQQLREAFCGR